MEKTIQNVNDDLIHCLLKLKNEDRLRKAQRNYPSELEIIGVIVPDIKKLLKILRKTTKDWSIKNKKQLALALTGTNYHEAHHMAYFFLEKEPNALKSLSAEEAIKLGACLDNWVLVDSYCTLILGVLWRISTIDDNYIHRLAASDNVWQRRCAVVSTVALNQPARGGKGDTKRTIPVCEQVVTDHRPMVVKALSWALRVLIGHDIKAVEEFIRQYDDKLHNQVKREVHNKLITGLKTPSKQ